MRSFVYLVCLAVTRSSVFGASLKRQATPTVQLDEGTFIGVNNGTTNSFLGIPFAQPPVGNLRLRLPVANEPYAGVNNATAFGPACFQQSGDSSPVAALPPATLAVVALASGSIGSTSEDCLSINVIAPTTATPKSKLPVVFWIYGGSFVTGGTASEPGANLVEQSITLGQDVIYVSANYRLNGFGFLGGEQVKREKLGNLGLQDQRLALRWIQKYISNFGGDPNQVIIWGESAGAISVGFHMITNGGDSEGLFHGAFMNSGSPTFSEDIANPQAQAEFDLLVEQTGCAGSSDQLQCLREVPADELVTAINQTSFIINPASVPLDLLWQPRVDGVFLTDIPQHLVQKGVVANVPFVTGNCDDEGTGLSLEPLNETTAPTFATYVKKFFFANITDAQIAKLEQLYPNDPAVGSPFDTGDANQLYPEFKRISAFQGDAILQAPRRFFLEERSAHQPTFAFLYRRNKDLPVLGSFHSSDLINNYNFGELGAFLIQFANHLTPNGSPNVSIPFPQYSTASPMLMTLNDPPLAPLTITPDNYRVKAMAFINQLSLSGPDAV